MNIDSNTTIAALCEKLREWSGCNGNDFSELLEEAADRLELLDMENTDLRLRLSIDKQDSNFWQQKATEAMNRIRRLEEAVDEMAVYLDHLDPDENYCCTSYWKGIKEAKP